MLSANTSEEKSSLSKHEIAITRNGRPVTRLVPLMTRIIGKRLGVAKEYFEVRARIEANNDEIAHLFSK